MGIVNGGHRKLGGPRNADGNPNQPLAQQHAVRLTTRVESVDIGAWAIGAVIRAKDGIQALARPEAFLDMRRRDGPRIARLVAACATPSVGAEALEERVRRGWLTSRAEGADD